MENDEETVKPSTSMSSEKNDTYKSNEDNTKVEIVETIKTSAKNKLNISMESDEETVNPPTSKEKKKYEDLKNKENVAVHSLLHLAAFTPAKTPPATPPTTVLSNTVLKTSPQISSQGLLSSPTSPGQFHPSKQLISRAGRQVQHLMPSLTLQSQTMKGMVQITVAAQGTTANLTPIQLERPTIPASPSSFTGNMKYATNDHAKNQKRCQECRHADLKKKEEDAVWSLLHLAAFAPGMVPTTVPAQGNIQASGIMKYATNAHAKRQATASSSASLASHHASVVSSADLFPGLQKKSRFPSVKPVKSPSISLVDSATASPRPASITTARSLHNRSQSSQFYAGLTDIKSGSSSTTCINLTTNNKGTLTLPTYNFRPKSLKVKGTVVNASVANSTCGKVSISKNAVPKKGILKKTISFNSEAVANVPEATSTSGIESISKNAAKKVTFSTVEIYHFKRVQGFCTVPKEGGCSLGMQTKHNDLEVVEVNAHRKDEADRPKKCPSIKEDERKKLLKASGIKIDKADGKNCSLLRSLRRNVGCKCKSVCNPNICTCATNGIKCQVEHSYFPCSCSRDSCGNPHGKYKYRKAKIKNHFKETTQK